VPGVYISYPFCDQKCTFCNFASGVHSSDVRLKYEQALLGELRGQTWAWAPETVYFGGGSPNRMAPALLRDLMAAIPSSALQEVTLECAPGTLTAEDVAHWRNCGVNRVSLGVQSFAAGELRATGRRHSAEVVESEIASLRSAGIGNINVDLIAGLPGQTLASWRESLGWLERLEAPHVSVYILEVDEDSRLGRELLGGGWRYSAGQVPSDEQMAEFYEEAVSRLAKMGIQRYEISNFARPGFESRHNLKYWQREPYLGFGLDAHSFDGAARWGNTDALLTYLSGGGTAEERVAVDAAEEHFFVGLRLAEGIEPSAEERERFATPIAKWTATGMLEEQNGRLRLAPAAVLLSNEIFAEFVHAS
jgi:oxygen-independent coproporphyrinogen III oxidase